MISRWKFASLRRTWRGCSTLAKFTLSTDKLLVVRGVIVKLPAGDFETEDDELIAALSGAVDVVETDTVKKQKPKGNTE